LTYSVGVEAFSKQLELLTETVPKVRRVAVLSNPANPSAALAINNVKVAARSLGVELQLLETREPDEFDGAFAAMAKGRAEALLVISDPSFGVQGARLADFAARYRLPSMHGVREMMLPTNGGQSDQALVDSSKASGATYSMVEWRRWRL
jgi:putative ABC transport system substrate-binding protein